MIYWLYSGPCCFMPFHPFSVHRTLNYNSNVPVSRSFTFYPGSRPFCSLLHPALSCFRDIIWNNKLENRMIVFFSCICSGWLLFVMSFNQWITSLATCYLRATGVWIWEGSKRQISFSSLWGAHQEVHMQLTCSLFQCLHLRGVHNTYKHTHK